MTSARGTLGGAPLLTVGCLVLAALIAAVPGLGDALHYERSAVAAGEWWRFAGGSWVHLSASHLVANCLGLAVVGWYLERHRRGALMFLVAGGSVASVIAVHFFEPQTARFGGLSGVVTGAIAFAALDGLRSMPRARPLLLLVLLMLGVKLLLDLAQSRELAGAAGVTISPPAHLGALVFALLAALAAPGQRRIARGASAVRPMRTAVIARVLSRSKMYV